MQKRFFKYLLSLLLLFPLSLPPLFALELTAQERAFIKLNPVIKVHNETDRPPFNFYERGKPQGISIDIMNRVAEKTGLKVQYVTGPSWDEFIGMIKDGRLDVMLNIVNLPERQNTFQFTSAYAKSLSGIYVNSKDIGKYSSFKDLVGKTVAVPASFDLEITLPKYHPEIKLLLVRDISACIEAVSSGKADAFIEEIGVVNYIISQRMVPNIRLSFQIQEEAFISDLTIGTQVDNPVLRAIIQKGLNEISGDEINRIRKKWLLQVHEIYERRVVDLSVQEKRYLYEHSRVRICVDPSWQPLDFIDDRGRHSGLSADLIGTLAKRLGTSIELVPTASWRESLAVIREGGCDIIPLMNETKASSNYLNFTRPYFDFATVIVTNKDTSFVNDYSELHGKKVALQSSFFITEYVEEHHPEIQIVEVENTREALKLLNDQDVYATIDGLPAVVNTIEAQGLENVKIAGSVPQQNKVKLGVTQRSPMLLSIFDKAVGSLTEQEKVSFYWKWLNIDTEKPAVSRAMIIGVFSIFALFVLFLLWRQLAANRRTKDLKALNRQLEHHSTIDHLTQVLNRRAIEKLLHAEIEKSNLIALPLTLVIFDIDHFKNINDTFGHQMGDKVLKDLARNVSRLLRQTDYFGRWGGEEFIVIIPGAEASGCLALVEKVSKCIAQLDFGFDHHVTASFGVGQLEAKENVATFISRVDTYLYEAKEQGRNRIVLSSSDVESKYEN